LTEFRSFEVFYWVAHLGGFGRAAEKLNTTQPAVSARIAQLEAAHGVQLLTRKAGRRPALTAKGAEVFALAARMLALQAEIGAALAPAATLRGPMRLGISETIVHTWLPSLLQRLHAAHPALEMDIRVDASSALHAALQSGSCDVALMLRPLDPGPVRLLPLCRYALALAGAPALRLGPEPIGLEALLAHAVITYGAGTQPCRELLATLTRPGLPRPRVIPNSSLGSMIRMAVDGIGLCTVPPDACAAEVAAGRLRWFATAIALPQLDYVAGWMESADESAARTVAEVAAACAAEAGRG
jgi:DNA-binding transcriptional LysR family regulator